MYCNAIRGRLIHDHKQHAQKMVKFGCTVFELCEWMDRQTQKQTDYYYNTLQP